MQHEALKKKQAEKQEQEQEEEEGEGEQEDQEQEEGDQEDQEDQEDQSQSTNQEQYDERELREEQKKKTEEDEESSWSGLSSASWSEEGKEEKKKRGRRRGSGSIHHHAHHSLYSNNNIINNINNSNNNNSNNNNNNNNNGSGALAIGGLSRTELRDKIVSHTLKPVKTGGARKPRRGGSTNDMVDFREFPEVVDAIIDFSGLVYNYNCKDSSQLEDRVLFVGGHLNQQLLRIPRGEYAEFFLGKDTRKTSIEYIPNRLKEAVRTNNAQVLSAYTRVLDAAQRAGIPRDPSKPYISD